MYLFHQHKILIAGSRGMVGSALTRCLLKSGYDNLLLPVRQDVDFTNQIEVQNYLAKHKPDVIVIAAAKVGGILANSTYPADFLYENLMIATNLIHEAHKLDINRILYLGSSCIYPKFAPQPIEEEALLTGALEPTNEAYAIAKIAGLKLCHYYQKQYGRKYISAMPTNLYGPGDNYHPENSHVVPALLRKFHVAKLKKVPEVTIWGSGQALREFLHVDDLAEALLYLLKYYEGLSHVNIGSDEELSINDLARMIAKVVGYQGEIKHDLSKPEGTPRKKILTDKIYSLGWKPKIPLFEGLLNTYSDLSF